MTAWLLTISLAYLLGSIPFGYVLVRTFRKQDIRTTGSGNIGATNVARSGAKGLGVLTLMLDMAKGMLAVLAAYLVANHFGLWTVEEPAVAQIPAFNLAVGAAVAAVLGHVYPVWLQFRGGKGVATALGVFLALSPRLAGSILLVFLLVIAFTRFVSLGSIIASATVPLFALLFFKHFTPVTLFGFLFIPLLVIAKHHANIARLLQGVEPRMGASRTAVGV